MDFVANGVQGLEPLQFLLIGLIACVGAVFGGLSGFGAGLIVTPFLLPVVGVKAVIPVMSIAMLLGNLSRLWVYRARLDRSVIAKILIPAIPCVILGTILYDLLPQRPLAACIGVFLLMSIPLRRWLAHRKVTPTPGSVIGFSTVFGLISGALPGGGVVLMPLLLGMGLSGGGLVGTDAVIGIAVNMLKVAMFGTLDLVDLDILLAGLLVGLCMVPGAYGARWLIDRLHVRAHTVLIEVMVTFSGISFIWSALSA